MFKLWCHRRKCWDWFGRTPVSAFLCDQESQHWTGKPIGSRVAGPGGRLTGLVIMVWCWIMGSCLQCTESCLGGVWCGMHQWQTLLSLSDDASLKWSHDPGDKGPILAQNNFKCPFLDIEILWLTLNYPRFFVSKVSKGYSIFNKFWVHQTQAMNR